MDSWEYTWNQVLKNAPILSFTPNWRSIFRNCPYTVQYRAELKHQFFEIRKATIRKLLRQDDRPINLMDYIKSYCDAYPEIGSEAIRGREDDLKHLLSRNNIQKVVEDDLIEALHYSWVNETIWSDYPDRAIAVIKRNGLPKLRNELAKLLYGKPPLHIRFDNFKTNITGFGAQYTSEILAFIFPKECCLWSRLAANASVFLGISRLLPKNVWKHRLILNGKDYLKCCEALKKVKYELIDFGFKQSDFLDVYNFMLYVYACLKGQPGILDEIRSFTKEV